MRAPCWDAMPAELRVLEQWVPWRYEERGGKRTKVPLDARDPRKRASATDSAAWAGFEAVRGVAAAAGVDGVGFVVTADGDLAGVDVDDCLDPVTRQLSLLAAGAVAALASYTEVTPSGRGIRIWVRAPGASFERKKYPALNVELYTDKRFLTVTGHVLGEAVPVEERGEALARWWDSVGAAAEDADLLRRARAAKSGEKFAALYDRGEHDHGSDSEADLALCSMLAYWAGDDPDHVDRLFRASALMRSKWDREDYRERTITRALDRSRSTPGHGGTNGDEKTNVATVLVGIAEEMSDFVPSEEGEVLAVPREGPRVGRALRGGQSFRQALSARYFVEVGKAASSSALADALGVLEGKTHEVDRERAHVRLAPDGEGGVFLDLGDPTGAAVHVRPGEWSVTHERGPLFRRTALTSAMPEPQRGTSLTPMRSLLNISDEAWDLLLGYMVSAWVPDIPHPILWMTGEQGTGKTSAMRMVASLLDPSPVETRTSPRDIGEWVVTLSGSWVVPVDNVSKIPEWLSDSMCRAATGDGLARRQLYADNAIVVNKLRNCVMLTGIGIGDLRGDLGDRLLPIELHRISQEQRRLERTLTAEWEAMKPGLYGALLDLLVQTLAALPSIDLETHPRMADFAEILAAVDKVRGTHGLTTYLETGYSISEQVNEGDPVAIAIQKLAGGQSGSLAIDGRWEWSGSATELLDELLVVADPDRRNRSWPANGQQLSVQLRRAAPGLAAVGIEVRSPSSNKRKIWHISGQALP